VSNTEDFLNVIVQNDWRTSHVKAFVRSGENILEGKITECVDGTVTERKVMYVYGEGEKYELKRWDDRTFCWTPIKGAKNKRTPMEVTWIACN
jgi:hypothetical protein